LISGVASEISRPLEAIISGVQYLESTGDPKTVKTSNAMLALTRRIEKIIDSLSVFARQGDDTRVEGNINHAILSITGLLRFELKRSGVRLELDLDQSLPNTQFNVNQIEKLLIKLIENSTDSLKSIKPDKRLIRIATGRDRLSDGRPCSFITVTDTGEGMDSESVGSIFDPFYTTKNDSGAVGLGLSICHGIVKAHGGSIDVESSLGHGATFVIRLPSDEVDSLSQPLAA
jgi:two-component system NtrC family sensor kinase